MTGGLEDLMRQAQRIQKDMGKVQDSLKNRVVEGKASGGVVTCMINGARECVGIRIDPDAVTPDDVEMLEDLVIAAVNAALKKAEEMISREMGKVSGGLNIPGIT
ncbi:MAG: YbaB/EbfC family nucleoid-associated protein [Planctomycetota bacterium]